MMTSYCSMSGTTLGITSCRAREFLITYALMHGQNDWMYVSHCDERLCGTTSRFVRTCPNFVADLDVELVADLDVEFVADLDVELVADLDVELVADDKSDKLLCICIVFRPYVCM